MAAGKDEFEDDLWLNGNGMVLDLTAELGGLAAAAGAESAIEKDVGPSTSAVPINPSATTSSHLDQQQSPIENQIVIPICPDTPRTRPSPLEEVDT